MAELEDSLGKFTHCSRLGASVVDYSITDIDPNCINAFIVRPQLNFISNFGHYIEH